MQRDRASGSLGMELGCLRRRPRGLSAYSLEPPETSLFRPGSTPVDRKGTSPRVKSECAFSSACFAPAVAVAAAEWYCGNSVGPSDARNRRRDFYSQRAFRRLLGTDVHRT